MQDESYGDQAFADDDLDRVAACDVDFASIYLTGPPPAFMRRARRTPAVTSKTDLRDRLLLLAKLQKEKARRLEKLDATSRALAVARQARQVSEAAALLAEWLRVHPSQST